MSDKTAVVVGASSGIGAELAEQLAEKGYHVGLIARRQAYLEDLQKKIGNASILTLDVTAADASEQFLTFLDTLENVELIILNAGIGTDEDALKNKAELQVVDVNVRGLTDFAVTSYNYFKQKGRGHIVGISSILALCPCPQGPAYAASKAYVASYMASLRQRAKMDGANITVTDIKPGFVATPMTEDIGGMFWVAPAKKAASQIVETILKKKNHAYITYRWRLIGWLMKATPIDFLSKCISKLG